MNKAILAAAATLSMAAVPAFGQVHDVDSKRDYTPEQQATYDALTIDQRTNFDSWPADRQVVYFGWPYDVQGYYWTLEPVQQDTFWYLDDTQRISLYRMPTASERVAAWDNYLAAYNKVDEITFVNSGIVQNIATHDTSDEYPICKSDMDDHCINAWAAGQRGPNVDRPLDYWPGEAVTDMRSGG